jgi:glycosyltransferase involved in cell wall biosynthesis
VQQALAHGLPVVVAAGDGSQEDMVQKTTAVVRPDDLADLSRALRAAIGLRPTWPVMGEASRRKSRLQFNLEAMVEARCGRTECRPGEAG